MKGYNEYQHVIRHFEYGGSMGPKSIKTVCNKTGKKVGSADCERNCSSFAGHDQDLQRVLCRK